MPGMWKRAEPRASLWRVRWQTMLKWRADVLKAEVAQE
jgi:hypothetical protein